MAFLRFSRDKRGVESFCLVHATANRRGKVSPRVLYWFRTPPDIRVGREPFDAEMRRALEKQNPDITFDWRAIQETPIPSADADKWRERRRVERAAKHAARAEEGSAETTDGDPETERATDGIVEPADAVAALDAASNDAPLAAAPPPQDGTARGADANRKRRRRRRSGGSRAANTPAAEASGHPAPPSSSEPSGD